MTGAQPRIEPRPWLAHLPAYRAGQRAVLEGGSLASNESLATSPKAAQAIVDASGQLHRYPDPLASRLRERLAALHDTSVKSVLVGSGSDELMFLLASAYVAGGGSVVCADPGYWGHEFPAKINGAEVRKVPCIEFHHNLDAMASEQVDIAFVCNPHNPTGTLLGRSEIERFVDDSAARLTVVDEAYMEFADDPLGTSVIDLAAAGRLVVLRTMSKFYGLAGVRVGYLVGPEDVVDTLVRLRAPFSVNALAQAAAIAALDDLDHQAWVRKETLGNREAITELFRAAGFVVVPSQANFVLVLTSDEGGLLDQLASAGVAARPGSSLGIPGSVRLTVPSEQGLAMVSRALDPST